jgi:hypothetical protein
LGKLTRSSSFSLIILLLISTLSLNQEVCLVSAAEDILESTGYWGDIRQSVKLQVSSKNVKEGSILTIIAVCTRTGSKVPGVDDFIIGIDYGEVKALSWSPPEDHFGQFTFDDYGATFHWGKPDSGSGGTLYSSPATFTVKLQLGKPTTKLYQGNPIIPKVVAYPLLNTEPDTYTVFYLNTVSSDTGNNTNEVPLPLTYSLLGLILGMTLLYFQRKRLHIRQSNQNKRYVHRSRDYIMHE